MSNEALRTEKVGRFTVELHYDTDAESPREWDNVGKIAAWHRRHNLGDEGATRGLDPAEFKEWLDANPNVIALPVFMYEHSGICLSTGAFGCRWDSGQLGFIYVDMERARKEWGGSTADIIASARACLESEIKTYSAYVEGRNYGYVVKDKDGEQVESCWGYIGDDDYAVTEGKSVAQGLEDAAVAAEACKFPVANWMFGAKP